MGESQTESAFGSQLLRELQKLNTNVERLADMADVLARYLAKSEEKPGSTSVGLDADILITLPPHLRKTAMTLAKLGEATALQVSSETGRVRAAESERLNQLVEMGRIRKRRVGKTMVFAVK